MSDGISPDRESGSGPSRLRRILSRLKPRLRRRGTDSADERASSFALPADEVPVDELDSRLQALRQRSSGRSATADAPESLYDVDELLVTPEIIQTPGTPISPLALTKAQQEQVELLREMVGAATPDEGGGERRRRLRMPFRRALPPASGLTSFLIALIVFIGVALPFVSSDFREGDLPMPAFGADRPRARAVYDALEGLLPGETALVALEYGPTAAGELDPMTDLVLRHILARGAKPLILSNNPIAIAHARNIMADIADSVAPYGESLIENRDYVILRFLSGGVVGFRDLSRNFNSVVRYSSRGVATGLSLRSLDNLTLIALIAERAEDARSWAEQIAPETTTPLLVVTGYAAQPLASPYVDQVAGIGGLLVGMRDVYTYGEMLHAAYAPYDSAPRPTLQPSATFVPTATPPPAPSDTPTPLRLESSTPLPSATLKYVPSATPTAMPSATPTDDSQEPSPVPSEYPTDSVPDETLVAPLVTVIATARQGDSQAVAAAPATETPTSTPIPSETPTATPVPLPQAVIKGPLQARIRRDPTIDSPIVGLANEGESLPVLGENADGSWLQVELPNGWRGWIYANLVDVSGASNDASASVGEGRSLLRLGVSLQLGKPAPRIYQAPALPQGARPQFALRRDREDERMRLHAMTYGTIAAALIIALGNTFHLIRGALRGGRDNEEA